jgi:hypothetical protein
MCVALSQIRVAFNDPARVVAFHLFVELLLLRFPPFFAAAPSSSTLYGMPYCNNALETMQQKCANCILPGTWKHKTVLSLFVTFYSVVTFYDLHSTGVVNKPNGKMQPLVGLHDICLSWSLCPERGHTATIRVWIERNVCHEDHSVNLWWPAVSEAPPRNQSGH